LAIRTLRALAWQLRRTQLRVLARVAPDLAARRALATFARPLRPQPRVQPAAERLAVNFRATRLAVWRWGTGPTVLLSHGWSGHVGHMMEFVAPLTAAGFRVVAFDHPAHGSSAGRRSNMLEFRDALLAVAAATGPLTAVVGHSLGATAAILALDRGLRVDKVALIAPPLDPTEFARPFAAGLGLPEPLIRRLLDQLRAFVRADLGDRDAMEVARGQALPALFVHDRDDRAVPIAGGEALAAAWTGARLVITTGLGHRRILNATRVLGEVTRFLTGERDS
jgi:pimeloyl-ACP methyl ester carboxylesterase